MPTNIIDGRADDVGPSGWSTAGAGLGQLSQMLSAAMSARAADQAAKKAGAAVQIPGSVAGVDPGPSAAIPEMDPGVLGNPAADLAKLTASAPPPGANPFSGGAGSGNLGVAPLDLGALGDRSWTPFGSPTNATASRELGNSVWDRAGVGNVLPLQFPGLFPQRNRNLIQYGGL